MPLNKLNFSNTVLYKVVCKDITVKDLHVGSCQNITKKKNDIKTSVNKESHPHYNRTLPKFIRDNGGWDNWQFLEISKTPCLTRADAENRVRDKAVELNASL